MDPVSAAVGIFAALSSTRQLLSQLQRHIDLFGDETVVVNKSRSSLTHAEEAIRALVENVKNEKTVASSAEEYNKLLGRLPDYIRNQERVIELLRHVVDTKKGSVQRIESTQRFITTLQELASRSDLLGSLIWILVYRTERLVVETPEAKLQTISTKSGNDGLWARYLAKLRPRQILFLDRTAFAPGRNGFVSLPSVTEEVLSSSDSRSAIKLEEFGDNLDAVLKSCPIETGKNDNQAQTVTDPPKTMRTNILFLDLDSESALQPQISLGKDSFATLMEYFKFSAEFLTVLLTGTAMVFETDTASNIAQSCATFVLRMPLSKSNNWTLALVWDHQRLVTSALLHGFQKNEVTRLLTVLEEYRHGSNHPFLLPVLLCELLTESDSNAIKTHASNLYKVELRTNYLKLDRFAIYGKSPMSSHSPEDDFEDLTRQLNAITSRLAFHEMRINANINLVKSIKSHIATIHLRVPTHLTEQVRPFGHILERRLDKLHLEHTALLVEIACNQKIASGQLQIVYNLIAQRDNLENFRLAAISTRMATITKEDSYAMRTIAVMTVAFLPATAISSIFSMTMFDWNAGRRQRVVSDRFWIYWIVAVPLTIVVLVIWFLWMRMHRQRGHEELPQLEKQWMPPGTNFQSEKESSAWSISRIPGLRKRFAPEASDDELHLGGKETKENEISEPPLMTMMEPVKADTFAQGPLR